VDAPHLFEVHALKEGVQRGEFAEDGRLTKYPVRSVRGRNMMVASVRRFMTTFISLDVICMSMGVSE
jgi:hypothetical protein